MNNIPINILDIKDKEDISEYSKESMCVFPIYSTKLNKSNFEDSAACNLLYYKDHFNLITKLNSLLKRSNSSNKTYTSPLCFSFFSKVEAYNNQKQYECKIKEYILRIFPLKVTYIIFKNTKSFLEISKVLYYDIEVYFTDYIYKTNESISDQIKRKKHNLYSCCIYLYSKIP